jgi:hypothetical protein
VRNLKLEIAVANDDNTVKLSLERNGKEISVTDGDWTLITFRVDEESGQVVFARNGSIDYEKYSTDDKGRIVEVNEY